MGHYDCAVSFLNRAFSVECIYEYITFVGLYIFMSLADRRCLFYLTKYAKAHVHKTRKLVTSVCIIFDAGRPSKAGVWTLILTLRLAMCQSSSAIIFLARYKYRSTVYSCSFVFLGRIQTGSNPQETVAVLLLVTVCKQG